ncbi:Delta serrate ligand family protein [Acanthocheilonema viteae]
MVAVSLPIITIMISTMEKEEVVLCFLLQPNIQQLGLNIVHQQRLLMLLLTNNYRIFRLITFTLLTTNLIDSSGFVTFTLKEFKFDKSQGYGICCSAGHPEIECHCQMYVHICVGVGFEHRKYHRDCSLLHHNSRVIAGTRLLSNYSVSIPFDVRWPVKNVSLLVEMRHEPNKAIMFRSENFLQLSPSNDVLRITEEKGNTKIEYDVKVECGKNYYGQECAIFCNPSIGSFHFKCSSDGRRLCEDGWSGQNCNDPICANGCINGYCVSPGICKCRNGWQGNSCDRCKPQDGCKNGYCSKPNECICEKNWGGTYCDRDLDYCFHNSPCLNGGKCSSGGLQNYYYCNCTNGFGGQNCEIKLDPCAKVNCGKYGQCRASWNSERKYLCYCDVTHYGDHCQYRMDESNPMDIHFQRSFQPESCKLSNSESMPAGFSWTTVDCRHCICQKGDIVCSEKRCEPRDCSHNDSNFGNSLMCPKDQHCIIVTEDECLKDKCDYPRGRCLSWLQINSETARRICRERLNAGDQNTQGCARMYLEFDIDNLLPGTTSGDVCFHLLLDANAANITHIGFDCKLISTNTVQISLQFLMDVTMMKDFLKNRILNRLTTSKILAAVVKINDSDNHDRNEHPMLNAILTLRNSAISPTTDFTSLTTKQVLIIIICLMLLIILVLLNISIMKNPHFCARERFEGSRSNDNLLELQMQQPNQIYTTQALIKFEKEKQQNILSKTCNQQFLNSLKQHCSATEPFDSGIVDRELEENENNARILEQRRMKSKLQILHESQSDNSILNPIRLQLTGNNVKLHASKNYHY